MLNFIRFQAGRKSLADKFEYVMHGKIYKISEAGSGPNMKGYIYVYTQIYTFADRLHSLQVHVSTFRANVYYHVTLDTKALFMFLKSVLCSNKQEELGKQGEYIWFLGFFVLKNTKNIKNTKFREQKQFLAVFLKIVLKHVQILAKKTSRNYSEEMSEFSVQELVKSLKLENSFLFKD